MDIPKLPPRMADSHKGTFGRTFIVGGSRGMTGSVCLAGAAALRAGAGLVSIVVPSCCLETVAAYDPNYMTVPVAGDASGRFATDAESQLVELMPSATSVAVGPGMSRSDAVTQCVMRLYKTFDGPMVVDADALNALASQPGGLPETPGVRILTPHIGEFRRLIREPNAPVSECRDRAAEFASTNSVILVLKGNRTLVTDGQAKFENTTGNPGMATGGSGDVLTGVISAIACQELSPLEAAVLGVHVHGIAGDVARDRFGEWSMVAENIKDCLPTAFQRIT